jgi:branched-chain amino acid transport system substrate-binding protein
VLSSSKNDLMGVYGRLRFDLRATRSSSTDPKEGAVGSILQWQAGKRVVVYPKSIAMGDPAAP